MEYFRLFGICGIGDEVVCVFVCLLAQFLDFPGAKVGFVNKLQFVAEAPETPVACFRVLDEYGRRIKDSYMPEVGGFILTDWNF